MSEAPLLPRQRRALLGHDTGGGGGAQGGGKQGGGAQGGVALPMMQIFGVTLMSFGALCVLAYVAWRAFEVYQRRAAGYVEMASW